MPTDAVPDLERLEVLLAKATPGTWMYSPWHIEEAEAAVRSAAGWIIANTAGDADAELIAKAKNALPFLLSRARQLDEAEKRATEAERREGVLREALDPESLRFVCTLLEGTWPSAASALDELARKQTAALSSIKEPEHG